MASRIKVLEDYFPEFKGDENTSEKLRKIMDYLCIQKEQLEYVLEKIDALLKAMEGVMKK